MSSPAILSRPAAVWARSLPILAVATLLCGCGDGKVNNCPIGNDNAWRNAGLQVSKSEPRGCPYTVRMPQQVVDYLLYVYAPSADYAGKDVRSEAFNSQGSFVSLYGGVLVYYVSRPECGTPACALLDGSFYGGTGDPIRDSISVESWQPQLQFHAEAWAILAGCLCFEVTMTGPSLPAPSQMQKWALRGGPPADTTSYLYDWRVDGQQVSGANRWELATTFVNGRHTITGIATLADYTTDTVIKNITVSLVSNISGPTYVNTQDACTWDAIASGGVPPMSYEWYLDGDLVTGFKGAPYNSPYLTRQLSAGGHSIRVDISDAAGQRAMSPVIGVTVDYTQPRCKL